MSQFLFFLFGLIVGSFLNVVIFRLHSGDSFVGGRSRCLTCKTELKSKDLVPLLSFLLLSGKCRYCRTKLSWQYPFVELATAAAFVLISLTTPIEDWAGIIFRLAISSLFIVIAVYDFKYYLILDKIIYPAMFLVLGWNISTDLIGSCSIEDANCSVAGGLLGALIASGFFALQYFVSKGRWIGFGDVKLGILLGLVAGYPTTIFLLFLAYILGAVVGLTLIATGKKDLSSRLPFGSFLSVSAIITLIYGQQIIGWYLNLLGLNA
jgi:leader peptidase (prepilin peptidase)/N-methyltransferase